jgi:hypothetical protein
MNKVGACEVGVRQRGAGKTNVLKVSVFETHRVRDDFGEVGSC